MGAMDEVSEKLYSQAKKLIQRLERLSADSIWAHRASGLRGALIRYLVDEDFLGKDIDQIQMLVDLGYDYLYKAAQEIPDDLE